MNQKRAVVVFAGTVATAGYGTLAWLLARAPVRSLTGPRPAIFWLLGAFLLCSEMKPIKWLRRQEGGEVTASWAFSFALVLVAPPAGALATTALATICSDIFHRKPLSRSLFNGAQVLLSLYVGLLILDALTPHHQLLDPHGPSWVWLPAALLAAAAMFLLNGALTCTILALHQGLPVWPMVRRGVTLNLSTDGMLLALAPIFVVVAERSLVLLPLLLVTAWAVYKSAHLALSRQHEATHDLLTNLPNRRLFYDHVSGAIEEAERRGSSLALVLLDLDGFKEINDRLGHHVGDLVLQEVARRLTNAMRPADMAARLGGDEFAVLLGHGDEPARAMAEARDLLQQLERPCVVHGFPVAVSGSLGVALYPRDGGDAQTLIERADLAMYTAKRGESPVQRYSETTDRGRGRLGLLAELHDAIADDQLVLHYQPKVDLRTQAVVGVEALVRWQHPRLGLVPPDQFMPMAEHTELMAPLTAFVLDRALEQCARWHAAGILVPIAVNGSARNLHDLAFPDTVETLLAARRLDAAWLELEITENTVMADPGRTRAVLTRLRSMGVSISIDDFGTGYSSLAHLRSLPIDHVKIDKSFVTDMAQQKDDALIVRSIIELARNLGLGTVAEGVEDEAVWAMLRDLGCDIAQGFLIARPGPPSHIEALLWESRSRPERRLVVP